MGIEVLCWGVRNMTKYQLAAVNSPSVEIEIGGTVLSSDVITNLKRTPNFKKSLMFHVAKLPKETLYMPPINIGVRDNRAFGRKPLVGTHVIRDITGFTVPPLMQPFDPLQAIPGKILFRSNLVHIVALILSLFGVSFSVEDIFFLSILF